MTSFSFSRAFNLDWSVSFCLVSSSNKLVASANWEVSPSVLRVEMLALFSASDKAVAIASNSVRILEYLSWFSPWDFSASFIFMESSAFWLSSCLRRLSFSCLEAMAAFSSADISAISPSRVFLDFSKPDFDFFRLSNDSFRDVT